MILGGLFDLDSKIAREKEIEMIMLESSFWDDSVKANMIVSELNGIKSIINSVQEIMKRISDNIAILDDILDSDDDILLFIENEYDDIKSDVDKLELDTYLSGEYDNLNAILEIHAGAGGTESCDWSNMLFRMYNRYADKAGYDFVLLDKQDGEEVGIKSIMFQVNGLNAYGYLKHENGIHRLVRISPFDSNKRRHTSFASVMVMPEIDKSVDVWINDNDIRVDIYRSSGPGGQGVNTTDSAVRITHIPTGIVVTCQNERSQIRNKEKALEVLKNKLYLLEVSKKNDEINDIRGPQLSNGFGSAKRSYVMCPYTLVKDNESGYETSNVNDILDGNINEMIEYNIKFSK